MFQLSKKNIYIACQKLMTCIQRPIKRPIKRQQLSFIASLSSICLFLSSCNALKILPSSQKNEVITSSLKNEAMAAYREFLSTENWYSLTYTERYPRGDSQAYYAFIDCNGNDVPELYVQGGNIYHLYTFRSQKVELLAELNDFKPYSSLQPLSDGTFLSTERWEYSREYDLDLRSSCRSIPQDTKAPLPDEGRDYYRWIILETENENIHIEKHTFSVEPGKVPEPNQRCSSDNCMVTAADFLTTWQHPEVQVERFSLFSQEEWEYLDALEEGNGTLPFAIEEKEREAWEAFQEILSGNFSKIKILHDRNRVSGCYSSSETTGRCIWRYLLMDINQDGHNELLVRYMPDALDYTNIEHSWGRFMVFFYDNEKVSVKFFGVSHESFIPLKTGQMVFMSDYGSSLYLMVAQIEEHRLNPQYSLRKHYLENGEYLYFYSQNCTLEGEKESEEISKEEWERQIGELQKQMIPDTEWFPASVFLPARDIEGFFVG